ncbi:hypothetical protein GGI21_006384 [Coemansia aciculifera]|nr:hypothetical protein GGI21_006384 [Coemansia aciculifera]
MLCYKNGSLAREWVRDHCIGTSSSVSWTQFNAAADNSPLAPAAYGFYYLAAEILPKNAQGIHRFERVALAGNIVCPSGTHYKRVQEFSAAACGGDARAILESQIMSMRLDYSRKSATPLTAAIVTGGASVNPLLRQIIADVFGVPVFAAGLLMNEQFEVGSLAMPAYGAAIRALRSLVPNPEMSLGGYVLQQVSWPDCDKHRLYSLAMADFEFLREHTTNEALAN